MSFDFGVNNIGVAIGQFITKTANPIGCIKAKNGVPNWDEIKNLINIWLIKKVIVGYSFLKKKHQSKKICNYTDIFVNNLNKKFFLKIILVDESYTSYESYYIIKRGKNLFRNSVYNIHSVSAVLILERWFESII